MVGIEAMESDSGEGKPQISLPSAADPRVPLSNLSVLRRKMDSLQQFLAESVDRSTLLGKDQMDMVSSEITSAIRQIIVNGAALLSCSQPPSLRSQFEEDDNVRIVGGVVDPAGVRIAESSLVSVPNLVGSITGKMCEIGGSARLGESVDLTVQSSYYPIIEHSKEPTYVRNHRSNVLDFRTSTMDPLTHEKLKDAGDLKDDEMNEEIDDGECEIVELGAVDILAEHIHICEICGKGFKRDANLRMHMRAHGNQFKTPEALAKPDRSVESSRRIRFSCPFKGCNRNKSHKRFRPLKSAICVKNHFKRSHCPKMFSCHLCNKKNFSVVADLKSHLRHCGESKWRCSCGTTFSRKDKLFGHVALFEGHMPAFTEEDEKFKEAIAMEKCGETEKEDVQLKAELIRNGSDNGFFDRLLEGFGSIDDVCFKDAFGSPGLDKEQQELYEIL